MEVREEKIFFLSGGECEGKIEAGWWPLQPPCVLFFPPPLCRLLTERKVYIKSPELTEISAKHTFTGL